MNYSPASTPSLSHPLVTGMGACCAGASGLSELWKNVVTHHVAATVETFPRLEQSLPVYRATLPLFSGTEKAALRHADRTVYFALAAAHEAWDASGLALGEISSERLGVIIGSARGPMTTQRDSFFSSSNPSASLYTTFASIAGLVAKAFRAEGPSFMVSSSCTSGATALHTAAGLIKSGLLDVAIVGGVEAPLIDSLLEQYQHTGILSLEQKATRALTPFAKNRSGTVLGEGAAFVVLESMASAERRGAAILGRLEAVCIATQSRYRAGLDHEGISLQKILQRSLQEASLAPHEIKLAHLHGTGTRLNDLLESRAAAAFFGPLEKQPYACATKAITGHTLGAAALFQAVLTLCALRDGIVPPTPCAELDPECILRLTNSATKLEASSKALCLTAGFWGNVSSIVLSA